MIDLFSLLYIAAKINCSRCWRLDTAI